MKHLLIFLTIVTLSLGANAMNSNTTHITLENGLDVVLVQDDFSPVISARTYVRAGSIDEGSLLGGGASHYLEHLVAGGTTSKNTEDTYKNKISLLGGAYNAYTTLDHTAYFINTTPEYTEDAVQILYEWMFYNTLDKSEFERERSVIQKEIEKNNAHLMRKFYYQAQRNFFKTHPIRFPVIGYLDRFNKITRDELEDYYKTYYVPSNMSLVIAGNLDKEALLKQIEETFGSQPMRPKPIRAFSALPKLLLYHQFLEETNFLYFQLLRAWSWVLQTYLLPDRNSSGQALHHFTRNWPWVPHSFLSHIALRFFASTAPN